MGGLEGSRIIVAGGTGLVGTRLAAGLLEEGAEVAVLSRDPGRAHPPAGARAHAWEELPGLLEGSRAVVNLAGEGLADLRWTPARKKALLDSRVQPTRRIAEALARASTRPSALVNASAVGIYGARGEEAVDESQPPGSGFLAELCRAWEGAADEAQPLGIRVAKLRLGVVLDREGGALPRIARPIRRFAGSALGNGRQGFSWIHIEDLVRLIIETIRNPAFEGPLNATAPHPCSSGALTRLIAARLHRPVWPLPALLTRGALQLALGEMAGPVLLEGAFVQPARVLELGFRFRFPTVEEALADLL